MKKWVHFMGLLGGVLLAFGLFGSILIFKSFDQPFMLLHVALGIIFIGVWFGVVGIHRVGDVRRVLGGRHARYGATFFAWSALFLGFAVCLNVIALRYDIRWDLTEAGVHSLSPESKGALKLVREPVHISAILMPPHVTKGKLEALLELYRYESSDLVTYEFVDPRKNPRHIDSVLKMSPGDVVHVAYGNVERGEQRIARLSELNEESVSNAILKLVRGTKKRVFYVSGHGEPDIESAAPEGLSRFAAAVSGEQVVIESVTLEAFENLPSDVSGVVLVSPKKPLSSKEQLVLTRYLAAGGSLLLMHDPGGSKDIPALADALGLQVGTDVVLDQAGQLQGGAEVGWQVVAGDYGDHPIVRSVKSREQGKTVYLIASSVGIREGVSDQAKRSVLVRSSRTAWAETDLVALFSTPPSAIKDSKTDMLGPVPLAVAYEGHVRGASKKSRVVVVGDSEWIRNVNFGVYANREFVLSALNWVSGNVGAVSVRSGTMRGSRMPITAATLKLILAVSFLVPELLLLVGLAVWWRRRNYSLLAT